ncbi:MAG TPA: hypothetical protein VK680_00910 [Solirubrobacteraceae bacterium]|jgi:hypothetical protein|nr:hypothetical protein [Solirubrobacteraceae bacterium]
MSGTRRTIIKLTLIVMIVAALAPAAANAGSLLSGYGGPGEGNQAILGSALLNGPSGKGGAGGGSGTGGTGRSGSYGSLIANATEGQSASSSRGSGGSTSSTSSRSSKSGGKQRHVEAGAGKASNSASQPYKHTFRASTETSGSGGLQPLGLSGADLLYILLALVVLALTGVVTRGLVRANVQGDEGPAQAMRRRTRLTN